MDLDFYELRWVDTNRSDGWESMNSAKTTKPAICITPGYVIRKTKGHIVIASSISEDLDDVLHHVSIPRGNIRGGIMIPRSVMDEVGRKIKGI